MDSSFDDVGLMHTCRITYLVGLCRKATKKDIVLSHV